MFQKRPVAAVAVEPDADDQGPAVAAVRRPKPPVRPAARAAIAAKAKAKRPPTRVPPQWSQISDQMLAKR